MRFVFPQGEVFTQAEILELCTGIPQQVNIEKAHTTLFDSLFRPRGVAKIVFHQTSSTQINFRWNRWHKVIIIINQTEWDLLPEALKYFVLMHEIGHLKTLSIGTIEVTQTDEDKADDFALIECQKVGFLFGSVLEARQAYQHCINQAFIN